MEVPLASGGGAGEEGGATALGTGEGRPATTVPREGECRPATARASARDGRRCCGVVDVGQAGDISLLVGAWAVWEVGRWGW